MSERVPDPKHAESDTVAFMWGYYVNLGKTGVAICGLWDTKEATQRVMELDPRPVAGPALIARPALQTFTVPLSKTEVGENYE